MFFNTKPTPIIIDENYDLDELVKFSKEYGNPIYTEDKASIWNAYALKIGLEKGLLPVEANSFGYMCSTFFGGMGYSCGTEMYFREEDIEYVILDKLALIKETNTLEIDQVQKLWDFILDLYLNHIEDYTLKTENLHIKLSVSMYQRFMQLDGETKTDKLRKILKENLHKVE